MPLHPACNETLLQQRGLLHTRYPEAAHADAATVAEVEYIGGDPATVGQLVHVPAAAASEVARAAADALAHELLSWLPPMNTVRQGGRLAPEKY